MTSNQVEIDTHTLFAALTRPAMTMGVTLEYHMLNLMVTVSTFIGAGSLLYLLAFVPVHLFGCAMFRYDIDYFSIRMKGLMHLPQKANKKLWGGSSYEPF